MRLYHVRGVAACIGDGVVDSCLLRHMLAQKLYADVHQLYGIQRRASKLRTAGGVGSDAGELVFGLDAGVAGAGGDLVDIVRVPGQSSVQLLPDAVARHKGFGSAALFAGAAIKDDGAAVSVLQIFFDGKSSCQRACTQHIVTAAVTAAAADQLFALDSACLLGQTGQRIILSQDADDRFAAAIAGFESGFDAGNRCFYGKAFFGKDFTVELGGLEFHQRKLCKVPNLVGNVGEQRRIFLDGLQIFLFIRHHKHPFCYNQFRANAPESTGSVQSGRIFGSVTVV